VSEHSPLVPPELEALGPTVIGATGGSGTRVVARIVRRAGLYVGADGLNESEDPLYVADFYDRWINVAVVNGNRLRVRDDPQMEDEFAAVLNRHLAGLEGHARPWGWKEPRSIYLLPFLDRRLPALRFLHVVRDGRDMALSANQNQLRKHGSLLGLPRPGLSAAAQSILLWSWINQEATRYGRERLAGRYLRVRFEDLCERPVEVAGAIAAFLELKGDPAVLGAEVARPDSLGRWREADATLIAELEKVGGPALLELGYELTYA
jgi:Sulfotransferase family